MKGKKELNPVVASKSVRDLAMHRRSGVSD